MDVIKTPKVERVLLHRSHHKSARAHVTGTLCLTDRHIIFLEPTALDETWILYHHILSAERQPLTTKGYPILITTKTFQHVTLIIPRESDCTDVQQTIKQFAQPERYSDLYAFKYRPSAAQEVGVAQTLGWNLYDPTVEYSRMGLPNKMWKSTKLNAKYELCDSYSSVLYVPASVDSAVIQGCAKFRSKGRLPVLSYYYSHRKSALCRCSQPLSYITRRSVEDEQMIQAIIDVNPHCSFLYLMDNRPKLNAVANKAARKGGYESVDNYSNVRYQFCNIHNIHVMRESLQKVVEGLYNSVGVANVMSVLESSSWLKHIHLLLEAAVFITKVMHHEGVSVVVHCSDGWDRTSQTCALTSLLLDPFYRTIHGFMVLIEKDWLSFGHKFSIRCGHLSGDPSDMSPIFTQFIDCVWQVMVQFPTAFQFNELFLMTLHNHLFSCQFGTFLGNCERERQKMKLSEHTYSLWGFMWSHLDEYMNPLYQPGISSEVLFPITSIPHLSFWRGLYCAHVAEAHPHELWEEQAGSIGQQNRCIADHIKFLQQHKAELEQRLRSYRIAVGEIEDTRAECDPAADSDNREELGLRPRSTHFSHPVADNIYSETTDASKASQAELSCESKTNDSTEPSRSKPTDSNMHNDVSKEQNITSALESIVNDAQQDSSAVRTSGVEEVDKERDEKFGVLDEDEDGQERNELDEEERAKQEEERAKQEEEKEEQQSTEQEEAEKGGEEQNDVQDKGDMKKEVEQDIKVEEKEGGGNEEGERKVVRRNRITSVYLRDLLLHVPEMNLPWEPLRSVTQCSCGHTFSFTRRKYHCSFCGSIVCGVCSSNHAPLPYQATATPQRICKTCSKLMARRSQDLHKDGEGGRLGN